MDKYIYLDIPIYSAFKFITVLNYLELKRTVQDIGLVENHNIKDTISFMIYNDILFRSIVILSVVRESTK